MTKTKMMKRESLRRLFPSFMGWGCACAFFLFLLPSCSSETAEYDPYHDWQARNAEWYRQIADSARRGGSDWLMLKTLTKSPDAQSGVTADSICVHILHRGTGSVSPTYSDSVRISFRGWLMPAQQADGRTEELIFTQTYYGDYDPVLAAPQLAGVQSFTPGFATALQYMVEGDDWMVYIPQQLAYGATVKGTIPAYSTLRFRIQLVAIYPLGTKIPDWK